MDYILNDSGKTTYQGAPRRLVTSSIPCQRLDIQAPSTNVGVIYIGGPSVSAITNTGIALSPGDIYNLELVTDAINVWIDGTDSGDIISWNWWKGSNV